jgi:hypothetical protein
MGDHQEWVGVVPINFIAGNITVSRMAGKDSVIFKMGGEYCESPFEAAVEYFLEKQIFGNPTLLSGYDIFDPNMMRVKVDIFSMTPYKSREQKALENKMGFIVVIRNSVEWQETVIDYINNGL